ncbi:MAG TPA: hypothetical protein VNM14_14045 [Planctomycetota bacterium]|jgi:hypothetical protein|nr:hypothetical protein [Planctomycetota bacterium]
MSDEAKPLPPRRLGAPGAAVGAGPKGPRPARPAAPPPPSGGAGVRKALLLSIIFACLGLGGAIAWKVWKIMHPVTRESIDVGAEFDKLTDRTKGSSKDIFKIQEKVWLRGEELKADDYAAIKPKLDDLVDCEAKLAELLSLLRRKNLQDSGDYPRILAHWLQMRMWIYDASDLLENQKPPEYGGLNVPMFVTSKKISKAQEELKEINTTKEDIIKRNDPAEIKAVRKKIADLKEIFRTSSVKLQELDKYVADSLARPDLTSKEVMELEMLRDDANKATMANKASGELLKAFPE